MSPDTAPCTEKKKPDFQEWLKTVEALAARATPDSLLSLVRTFYENGQAGKNKLISVFQNKPDKSDRSHVVL